MATHIVVGLAVTTGLHLTARSWRNLASKSESKFGQMKIEKDERSYRWGCEFAMLAFAKLYTDDIAKFEDQQDYIMTGCVWMDRYSRVTEKRKECLRELQCFGVGRVACRV